MIRRCIVYLVCLSLTGMGIAPELAHADGRPPVGAVSESEILQNYPNAKIIHVSAEDYPRLAQMLQRRGYRQAGSSSLVLAENTDGSGSTHNTRQRNGTGERSGCKESGLKSSSDDSIRVVTDITDDMLHGGRGSSGDDAAVVFIIIGAVVLIVWTLYIFKYLYDISVGIVPCDYWKELTLVTSVSSSSDEQHARLHGLRFSTGYSSGLTDVGLSLELGKSDILLKEISTLQLKGGYWLLGPTLRWRLSQSRNPTFFHMDFVAGSTDNSAVGLMARAGLGLMFGIGDAMQMGLSFSALNINLNEDQGIISDRSRYQYLYGINFGYNF